MALYKCCIIIIIIIIVFFLLSLIVILFSASQLMAVKSISDMTYLVLSGS